MNCEKNLNPLILSAPTLFIPIALVNYFRKDNYSSQNLAASITAAALIFLGSNAINVGIFGTAVYFTLKGLYGNSIPGMPRVFSSNPAAVAFTIISSASLILTTIALSVCLMNNKQHNKKIGDVTDNIIEVSTWTNPITAVVNAVHNIKENRGRQ